MAGWRQIVVAAVVLMVSAACGQQPAPVQSTLESADPVPLLDGAIDDAMHVASFPGAIVGVWGPRGNYLRAFGVADKSTGQPMTVDLYSRIGSVTKSFTVTAVLQLADRDKLRLDDPIAYVDSVPDGNLITLRQLAGMQSCLYNYTDSRAFERIHHADPQHRFSPADLLEFSFSEPPLCLSGNDFHYSNTNAILLGLVAQKVCGLSLPDYIRANILEPLRMSHTSFPTTSAFPLPHAQGYTNWTADGAEAIATNWNPSWSWAAGAVIPTLEVLHVWTIALATGELLSETMQRQRLQTVREPGVATDIGYGLGVFDLAGWIGHSGSVPGYGAVAVYLPEQQLALVVLVNTDIKYRGSDPAMTLAAAITKVISPDHVYDVGL